MKISVVIASYNRAEQLVRTLQSLLGQTLDRRLWEVVVVDNNSDDNTQQLFSEFIETHPEAQNIKIIFEKQQGLSYARNRGIEEAKGEIIVMMDDDEEANTKFLESYAYFFDQHSDAAAAGGKMIALYEFEAPRWLSPYVERALSSTIDLGNRVRLFKKGEYPIGGNMAFRRETLNRYGLFDVNLGRTGEKLLGGEEKDLFNRIYQGGEKVYWTPNPEILHIIPEERLTREHLEKLSKMIGVSERIRTKGEGEDAVEGDNRKYRKRVVAEGVKWAGTVVLALGYTLTGSPAKGKYLFILRQGITKGLLGRETEAEA